jgi:hypothetical protein
MYTEWRISNLAGEMYIGAGVKCSQYILEKHEAFYVENRVAA